MARPPEMPYRLACDSCRSEVASTDPLERTVRALFEDHHDGSGHKVTESQPDEAQPDQAAL